MTQEVNKHNLVDQFVTELVSSMRKISPSSTEYLAVFDFWGQQSSHNLFTDPRGESHPISVGKDVQGIAKAAWMEHHPDCTTVVVGVRNIDGDWLTSVNWFTDEEISPLRDHFSDVEGLLKNSPRALIPTGAEKGEKLDITGFLDAHDRTPRETHQDKETRKWAGKYESDGPEPYSPNPFVAVLQNFLSSKKNGM